MSASADGATLQDAVTVSDVAQFPEVPSQQAQYLQNAPSWNSQDYNEAQVFNSLYDEAYTSYYEDATDVGARGRQILRLFLKWKPIVQAFVQSALRGDGVEDALQANLAFEPEGSTEATIRPLSERTFANGPYTFTPTSTGEFEYIPNTTDGARETATDNEQAFMIFGYVDYTAEGTVPYDYVQASIDDSLGVRRPFDLRRQMSAADTLGVADRQRGPLFVYPGRNLDLDLNIVEPGIRSGLYPVGIEVLVESATNYGGVMDS